MSADVLSGGDERPPRRRRTALLVVVVLLVVGAVGLERWERQRQLDALLAAAADAEQIVLDSRRSLSGLVSYSGAVLARPDLEPSQRAALLSSFAADTSRYPPRMARPRSAVAQVRPLPWDGELEQARAAYLARIDAWTSFVASAVEQPDTLLLERRSTRPARETAATALVAAADGRRDARVEEVRTRLLSR